MQTMEEIMKLDLYAFIGAETTATIQEIKKAYRKKALSCHPDKNPDNPKAAELFLQLSKALEILTDTAARAAYDRVVNARLQAKLRTKQLDAKRQKLIEELEAREAAARKGPSISDEQKLKAEIDRLQREGSRQLKEEQELMRQKILEELVKGKSETDDETLCRIKLKWKVEKTDTTNGGYNYDTLHKMMSKYGEIVALAVSGGKKGRALVQFKNKEAAEMAVQVEIGLAHNPLVLDGLWHSKKSTKAAANSIPTKTPTSEMFPSAPQTTKTASSSFLSFSSAPDIFTTPRQVSDTDFEDAVLTNLRRAQERKRLMEEIRAEDEGDQEVG
ncbi:dnaJ homolog subfamily C member 17 [Belonocnema kinseyi]|uniref:dnaJ homolog subfamily C member 17 n=1 Tax=Belonocnema kinseyi TaxID=2817044 RepID=UPI00143D4D67|nr:dnaJ homolog subfamily C member 17 [Belonocnema kinseyi]